MTNASPGSDARAESCQADGDPGRPRKDGADTVATRTARALLDGIRREESVERDRAALANLQARDLEEVRDDRRTAQAFWLNVYNAGAQLLLERRPTLFESRWRFFRAPAVTVAGVDLSLDDIEHGILRGNLSKYGLGYLPSVRNTGLGTDFRMAPDPRVHFALNCGAASCPAIRSYGVRTVDRSLDQATTTALEQARADDSEPDTVRVPRVCLWYLGDFGGPAGLRAFLQYHGQLPAGSNPSLRFRAYDWTITPRQFAGED